MQLNIKQSETFILPILPVRGIVPLPHNELTLEIGREKSIEALKSAEHTGYVFLAPQNNMDADFPEPSEIAQFGLVGHIMYAAKQPNGHYRGKFKIMVRAEMKAIIENGSYLAADVVTMPSFEEDSGDMDVLERLLSNEIAKAGNRLFSRSVELKRLLGTKPSMDLLSDVAAFSLKIPDEHKMKYVPMVDVSGRLSTLLEDLETEKQMLELEAKINQEMQKNVQQHQRDYMLREKVKAIHKELGDEASSSSAAQAFYERLKKSKMPKSAAKKVKEEIRRFELTPTQSAESGVLRNYIEWMLDIPWHKSTRDKKDLAFAEVTLNSEHYGLEKVKDRILEYLAVKAMTGKTPPAILCLAGPPGVGKTSLAKSIADSLGRKFVKMSLGGVRDEAEIRGHRRTYIGSMPGRIIQGMKKAGTVNPVFLLDEIDKMASDFRGDPASAMLEVLDPEQNKMFNDHYVEEDYDLSNVLFIATANDLGRIPAPLRDRMDIIELSSYTEIEKFEIAKRHLIEKQLEAHGLTDKMLQIQDNAVLDVIRYYTREAGVRQLERNIAAICRKSARTLLSNKRRKSIKLTPKMLVEMLGPHKFEHSLADKEDQVGVVMGLAYTQAGGDILPIEVAHFAGKGKIVLTGKLGDVMKESAQLSVSYVRSRAKEFKIDDTLFDKEDIHIHVPDGATPKDGPSAGITMTTAIISALTGKKVRRDIGMTGEVTLRGRVGKIGGLKEKAIAGHRSGLKTILIPKENEKDLEDIPETVRKDLKIVSVETIDDVLKEALV